MPISDPRAHSVFVVAGPAGSGKSTLGRALAAALPATVVDQDIATNPLMDQLARLVGAGDDLDHPGLRGPVRDARYQCVIDIAVDNGRIGQNVVMIAPFTREGQDPQAWAALVRQFQPTPVHLVWVTVPPEVALARRINRNLARDRKAQGQQALPSVPDPVVPFLAADGAAEPRAEARRVLGLVAG